MLSIHSIFLTTGYLPMSSSMIIYLWALFSTMSRVLSITTFFIPGFGLYDLLYHWKAEQIPFSIR